MDPISFIVITVICVAPFLVFFYAFANACGGREWMSTAKPNSSSRAA